MRELSVLVSLFILSLAQGKNDNTMNKFICSQGKCIQASMNPSDRVRYDSLDLCRLICSGHGSLWPIPTVTFDLGHMVMEVDPSKIQVVLESAPIQTRDYIHKISDIFFARLYNQCANTTTRASVSVRIHMRVISSSTELKLLTDESYKLSIKSFGKNIGVEINATTVFGIRHGLETLLQLTASQYNNRRCVILMLTKADIKDRPVFRHRGLLIDTSRTFLPLADIERTIDGMASVKLNVLHWHATDTHSFPLAFDSLPKLAELGAYSSKEVYTTKDMKHVIEYAKLRGVRVLLEIDSPGHAGNGWQFGEMNGLGTLSLCVNKEPWRRYCVQPPCGQMNPANPNLYSILGQMYKEISTIFQQEMFHMGGDEVHLPCWMASDEVSKYMEEHHIPRTEDGYMTLWAEFHAKALNAWDRAEIGILHQFAFSSDLQRMSVVTRQRDSTDLILYCKGSPEMIVSLSNPETDFMPKLREYTEQGYRVIALGWRKLEVVSYHKLDRLRREDVERDLNLVGLIILENRVKPETMPTIDVLKQAKIKIIMLTGDNIQTAESVARESGIVSQFDTVLELSVASDELKSHDIFYTKVDKNQSLTNNMYQKYTKDVLHQSNYKIAMTGQVWELIRSSKPELFPDILYKSVVFARMSGEQKQQVIIALQNLGYYVAMCGDGANDCGALKAAHVGISLSEAEASVASPFTSRIQNISCVQVVVKEGRAALTTSFGVFKFMIIYSVTEFLSTIILYSINTNLTDFQFLYIDMALVLNFASLFGRCVAYRGPLVSQSPLPSMLHILQILSLVFQTLVTISIQLASWYAVRQYSWFEPFHYTEYKEYRSYENFAIFTVSQFQYIASAFVFSQGPPFREAIYTNKIFFASLLIMICVSIYITLWPSWWIVDILELRYPPEPNFPILVVVLGLVHFLVSMFFEDFFINWILFKKLRWGVKYNKY